MKIAVLHDYADVFRTNPNFSKLAAHQVNIYTDAYNDPAKVIAQVDGCDAVVLTNQRVWFTRPIIEKLPQLKFVAQSSGQLYHLDLAACTEHGIAVSINDHKEKDKRYSTTAELAWGLILSSLRHLPYEVERLKQGHWQSTTGMRLFGKTLGIYAFGNIGASTARVGRAFGMKVVCWGREGSTTRAKAEGFEVAPSREAFFESCDVISLHLPLKKDTHGIITKSDLMRMKPTSLIVNTSRAPIIAEGALLTALKNGRPGYGAVDVFEEEPVIDANHPLLKMRNAVCTPHLGYTEIEELEAKYSLIIEQLLAFAAGKPRDLVNPEVLGTKD